MLNKFLPLGGDENTPSVEIGLKNQPRRENEQWSN